MSTLEADTRLACPRPTPFNEIERVLAELAELEVALMVEVERLKGVHAPRALRPGMLRYAGRDLWWWRVMLVTWAYSRNATESHPGDVLDGLKLALKHWSDRELRDFVSRLAMSGPTLPPVV